MNTKSLLLLLVLGAQIPLPAESHAPLTSSSLPGDHPNFKAWRDRRFGMFIHWGPVSLKGREISWSRDGERRDFAPTVEKKGIPAGEYIPAEEYDSLYKQFNPVKFNADEWIAIAKEAGMKYIVFVAKHTDGFCMFDTAWTDYKITKSPFGRDVAAELSAACRKQGISFGIYYCAPDWHHPDFMTENHARYVEYMHRQVRELLTNYGPVDELWFDGTGGVNTPETWDNPRLFRMIRQLQPQVVVNARCGQKGLVLRAETTELIGASPSSSGWGDFDTPEQKIGAFNMEIPWESCMTIGNQWAWRPNEEMKSLKQCLQALIMCAAGDGNFLFNVGPTPEGIIDARQAGLLKEMGAWLRKNGEAIYGTRGGPWRPSIAVASTRKGDRIYLHLLEQSDRPVTLPAPPVAILSAKLLHGAFVKTTVADGTLSVEIPDGSWDAIDTIVELTVEGSAMDIAPLNEPLCPP